MTHFRFSAGAISGLLIIAAVSCSRPPELNLIPLPAHMEVGRGSLAIDSLDLFTGKALCVALDGDWTGNPEGYELTVDRTGLVIRAGTETGIFYARQTLRQLYSGGRLPFVKITDSPRLPYRGLHLDVSRHFFAKEEVMKILDVMSWYKLNTFHFHLTDAGGWRIELDAYPELTSRGSYRTDSGWEVWWGNPGNRKYVEEGTTGAYGGYYTKADIREILTYAAERHITVMPEIEFPGHSEEVFAAYPDLKCPVPEASSDFCIGNPATIAFMEGVLDEIMELFPSEYIHIGGDEAAKTAWRVCPRCQALAGRAGLDGVDELQSYIIHHAVDYLAAHGRKAIGWDEIMEGGLHPGCAVTAWRGAEPGWEAAKMGHDAVMTPGAYLYFDSSQISPLGSTDAGYLPIKKVYSFDPAPEDLLAAEEASHVIGVQGNVWTEHIETVDYLEYMIFPRALAVAEIGWTPQEQRSWEDFRMRLNANIPVLEAAGVHTYDLGNGPDISMNVDTVSRQIEVYADAERYPAEIRYSTDGSIPTAASRLYKGKITVKDSADIVFGIFKDGVLQGSPTGRRVDYHRAIGKTVSYNNRLHPKYLAGGESALVDGHRGGPTYTDGYWQGYLDDLDCIIDMEELTDIHRVSATFMQTIGPEVYQPREVELFTSVDGETYVSRGIMENPVDPLDRRLIHQDYVFNCDFEARYLRLVARRQYAWIFIDEIVVW